MNTNSEQSIDEKNFDDLTLKDLEIIVDHLLESDNKKFDLLLRKILRVTPRENLECLTMGRRIIKKLKMLSIKNLSAIEEQIR